MKHKKMKKICFVSMQAYVLFNKNFQKSYGGSEVQLYQLSKRMAQKKKFSVSFIVGDFGQKEKEVYEDVTVIKSFPLFYSKFRYLIGIFYQLKFFYILYQVDADIYIQRAAGIETGIVSIFCKIFCKKFIYMTASSVDVDGSFLKMNWFVNMFYSFGLKNASLIITQNKDHQILLEKNYNKKSIVIKNSFTIPEKIPSIQEREFVLWVSSAQNLKQPEIFLEIARSISHEKFVMIINKNNHQLWSKIKKESENISNLEFIENVSFDEIYKYFSKAKIFVNTSTFEGFPNTFVQSSMYGTPIVSLNVNPDNFLEVWDCGFCAKGDISNLIGFIEKMSHDEHMWNMKSANARRYAVSNHNIDDNIEKILKFLD